MMNTNDLIRKSTLLCFSGNYGTLARWISDEEIMFPNQSGLQYCIQNIYGKKTLRIDSHLNDQSLPRNDIYIDKYLKTFENNDNRIAVDYSWVKWSLHKTSHKPEGLHCPIDESTIIYEKKESHTKKFSLWVVSEKSIFPKAVNWKLGKLTYEKYYTVYITNNITNSIKKIGSTSKIADMQHPQPQPKTRRDQHLVQGGVASCE